MSPGSFAFVLHLIGRRRRCLPWTHRLLRRFCQRGVSHKHCEHDCEYQNELTFHVFPFSLSMRTFVFRTRANIACRRDPADFTIQPDVHPRLRRTLPQQLCHLTKSQLVSISFGLQDVIRTHRKGTCVAVMRRQSILPRGTTTFEVCDRKLRNKIKSVSVWIALSRRRRLYQDEICEACDGQ